MSTEAKFGDVAPLKPKTEFQFNDQTSVDSGDDILLCFGGSCEV